MLVVAICRVHVVGGMFGVPLQENASNERHDGEEAKAEYDARCNDVFRVHRT